MISPNIGGGFNNGPGHLDTILPLKTIHETQIRFLGTVIIVFDQPGVIPASLNFDIASDRTGRRFFFSKKESTEFTKVYSGKNRMVHTIQNQQVKKGAENVTFSVVLNRSLKIVMKQFHLN